MIQDVEYNGILASSLGMQIKGEINLPSPEPNYEEYKVAGRDGTMIRHDGTYKDIKIKIVFNYTEYNEWGAVYRNAKKWLRSKGNRRLRLSRETGFFRKVKKIEIGEEQRNISKAGRFEVTFLCDPYIYLEDGVERMTPGEIFNPCNVSHPVYMITGNGTCTLTVNGKDMLATVGQNLTIDTERMIAYRVDGAMMNTSVTGDYEDLHLQPGNNSVSITNGFVLEIVPNWRCL